MSKMDNNYFLPNDFVEDYVADIIGRCEYMKMEEPLIELIPGPIGGLLCQWYKGDLYIELGVGNSGEIDFFWSHQKDISPLESKETVNIISRLLNDRK